MGSIDNYVFRATLASFAAVRVGLTMATWMARVVRGIDPMIGRGGTIVATCLGFTCPGFISMMIRPLALMQAISKSNARVLRLLGRPATA
jgi:lipopolysaccharide export LptBFGC system permease protein LptF